MKTKKISALAAAAVLLGNLLCASASAAAEKVSGWAQQDVLEAQSSGLIPPGLSGRLGGRLTRERFAGAAVKLYMALTGVEPPSVAGPSPFRDTADSFVRQAYKLGIVKGTGPSSFSPNAVMTREQLAQMLYNTLVRAGLAGELQAGGAAFAFADAPHIAAWSRDAVNALTAAGFMQGSPAPEGGARFEPDRPATGEQAIVLVNRIFRRFGTFFVHNEYELMDAPLQPQPVVVKDSRTAAVYEKAKAVLAEIIRPGMSDYEKELAIHDYLLLHVAYDYDNYVRNTVPEDSYTIYGAMIKGIAVCQGYAYAAQLLLEMAGIETHLVTGTAGGVAHAWNKVKIDGDYYNLDVTWDDPVPDVAGRVAYGYFNVTDEELRRDHSWHDQLPAAAATKYNYYAINNLIASSPSDFDVRVGAAIDAGENAITLKRLYADPQIDGGIGKIVARYPDVSGYTYTTDSSNVITYTFTYR
ncbi:S-layer homology domain-containing protein [Paenibacillus humicola]|uniref:S-layer homology domain-containing protein n=1 Tax=Paenibacillus humicola TaxID=3110540 RepID=UPI00237A2A7E|nr:S-layer homology domain-containing protein [Paenibacillus humicola]